MNRDGTDYIAATLGLHLNPATLNYDEEEVKNEDEDEKEASMQEDLDWVRSVFSLSQLEVKSAFD